MKKNILKISVCVFCVFLFSVFFVFNVQAGALEDALQKLGEFNQGAQLPTGTGEIKPIIVQIINVILEFLALLFIILIIIGGFRYMTSGGNTDNAKKALDIIKNAVLGIIIVILAGVLVNFVILKIIEAI